MDSSAPALERSISLVQATIYGVGIILGAGIYALIGDAAGIAGNQIWLAFLVAALIASCSAIAYAELSSLYPKSAAEFVYVKQITGSPFAGFMVGYITIFTGVISVAAVALGFSSYFKLFAQLDPVVVSILVIVAAASLNFIGIQESARVNTVFTLIEAGGLLFIIVVGARYLGDVDLFSAPFQPDVEKQPAAHLSILSAAALVFFAYIGFEDIANIAEETEEASKNVPLAVFYSLIITTVIYILVAMVAVSVVPAEALHAAASLDSPTEGPLALVASTAMNSPIGGALFTVVALCATANTVLVLHIVSSRMIYGMARERCLPQVLSYISPKTRTPTYAVILCTALCALFALSGSLGNVAKLTNAGVFFVFFMVNAMLCLQRYQSRNRDAENQHKRLKLALNVGWFPVLPFMGSLFCIGMLFTQFWQHIDVLGISIPIIAYAAVISALGIPLYFISRIKISDLNADS